MCKEIDFKEFKNIFNNDWTEHDQAEWREKNNQYYSTVADNTHKWDYDAYIRRLQTLILEAGLDDNIDFKKLLKPEIITEESSEYLVKYKVCISDLIIKCDRDNMLCLHPLSTSEKINGESHLVKDKYLGGIFLVFNNITYLTKDRSSNHYININLGPAARIDFNRCVFDDVDLYISAQEERNYIYFQNTEFKNRHVTINGGSNSEKRNGQGSNSYSISPDLIAKKAAAKRLTKLITEKESDFDGNNFLRLLESASKGNKVASIEDYFNNKISRGNPDIRDLLLYQMSQDQRLEVVQDDVLYTNKKTAIICFKKCTITKVVTYGGKIYFIGENRIETISTKSSPEDVYFGPYNSLDELGAYARIHRPMFIAWKEYATKTMDRSLELILNRELLRIERHLLKEERKGSSFFISLSLVDSFVLWFNDVSSDFGMNWVKPLLFILFINLIFSIGLLLSLGYELNITFPNAFHNFGVFMELLSPLNSVSDILGENIAAKGWEGLNIIKNIVASVFLYQVIISFRKYGKK